MKKILVSACLLGEPCRYDGKSMPRAEAIEKILEEVDIVPFCPEVEGGLSTPRIPSEIRKGNVYNQEGKNVTSYYEEGARKALKLCQLLGIDTVILKEHSPSCGVHQIHSGHFNGKLVDGMGWTTALLRKNGITVYSENELDEFFSKLEEEKNLELARKEESRLKREQRLAGEQANEVAKRLAEEKKKLELEESAKASHRNFHSSRFRSKSSFKKPYRSSQSFGKKKFGHSKEENGDSSEKKPYSNFHKNSRFQKGKSSFHKGGSSFHKGNHSSFSKKPFVKKEGNKGE